jgi:hypothetical protein
VSDIVQFCQHVRSRCKWAQLVEGKFYRDMQMIACPSWEEKEKLEGKGVMALHVDELELFATDPRLSPKDKSFVCDLMLRFSGVRLLGISNPQ